MKFRYINRAQLAERLGVSIMEISRRERIGDIKHHHKEGPYGSMMYREEDVAQYATFIGVSKRMNPTLKGLPEPTTLDAVSEAGAKDEEPTSIDPRLILNYTAKEAQQVFRMIADNVPLTRVVIQLGIHPAAIRAIVRDYGALDGAIFIPGTIMAQINALPLDGNFPIERGEEMLALLKNAATSDCLHCHKKPKAICKHCVALVADSMEP